MSEIYNKFKIGATFVRSSGHEVTHSVEDGSFLVGQLEAGTGYMRNKFLTGIVRTMLLMSPWLLKIASVEVETDTVHTTGNS